MKLTCLSILITLLFFSCSFNKLFLAPNVIQNEEINNLFFSQENGVILTIDTNNNFQPWFINQNKDTLELTYTIESTIFKSDNGNKLNGWIISPKENYNGTTMFFCHGNSANIISYFKGTLPFVERGFQVFIYDYSGFGFSEGKATRNNVLIDGQSAFNYIFDRTQSTRKNLIIYGQSLGGHLSTTLALRNQDKIEGLITEGAFSSHKDIGAHFAWIFGRLLIAEKYSGLKAVRNLKKPILIIHSKEDQTIPFKLGEKLYKNATEPKTFYEIDQYHICGPFYYADSIVSKINTDILLMKK